MKFTHPAHCSTHCLDAGRVLCIIVQGASLDGLGRDDCEGCGLAHPDGLFHCDELGIALCDPCTTLAIEWPGLFSEDPDVVEAARQQRVCDLWVAGPEMAAFC